MTGIDAVLRKTNGFFDLSIDDDGDIETADSFDTAILYSIFGERRASGDEVVEPTQRRGWIGNGPTFENGSKIWLLSQARVTRDTLNRLQDEAGKALEWMVEDGLAVSIGNIVATLSGDRVILDVIIFRTRDKVFRRSYELWEATGRA